MICRRISKHSDWVQRRTSAPADWERRGHQEELPPVPLGSRLPERLEVAVVEHVNPYIDHSEIVHSSGQVCKTGSWVLG